MKTPMAVRPLLLLAALALAACGPAADRPLQGYAEGDYVRVASPFAGTLTKLEVQRGAEVKPGAPLFTLESENEVAARRETEDRAKRAEAQLNNLRSGKRAPELDAIRAQLDQTETALRLSTAEYARQQDLVAKNFVSKQALDEARAARDRDRAKVAELKALLATAQMPARPDEVRAAEFEVAASRQALAQADWRLRQKSAISTVGGVVTDTNFVAGEWVPAGSPVVAILPPENIKVRFFVPEPGLGAIKVGRAVQLACDGCPAPINATVSFIAPQAEYTPPVIYSKDSRAKLVFLVEARPSLADATKLKPGQPVDVTLK
jgi:HlyD family secretion protein